MRNSRRVGFLVLCALSGSGWLLGQIYPSAIGFPLAGCIHFLLIAFSASIIWVGSRAGRVAMRSAIGIALGGAGVFALPGVSAHWVAGAISEATSAALFCSITLLTLLGVRFVDLSSLNLSKERQPSPAGSRSLLASVVAIGGVVLLLSADLPSTSRGWLSFGLLAMCCATLAAGGIWMFVCTQRMPVAAVVSVASFGAAALLASGITKLPEVSLRLVAVECLRCVVFDLPVVWLTAWLIREVHPARLSARYLLAPAMTAVEGYMIMRGGFDLRSVLALAGMMVGGALVFLGDETEEVVSLHLR